MNNIFTITKYVAVNLMMQLYSNSGPVFPTFHFDIFTPVNPKNVMCWAVGHVLCVCLYCHNVNRPTMSIILIEVCNFY